MVVIKGSAVNLIQQSPSGNKRVKMSNPEERQPCVCPTCGKAYTRAIHLQDHQESVHQGIRYICFKCQKSFVREAYRNHHQLKCTGTHYSCNDCHQDFTSLQQLRSHRASAHQSQINNRRRPHPPEARPSTSRNEATAAVEGPSVSKQTRSEPHDVDPLQPRPQLLPQGDDELTEAVQDVYAEHWSSIRTYHRAGRVQDMYNFRIQDLNMNQLRGQLMEMFQSQNSRFKINVSFGFILRNIENGELRYYHSSHNLGRMLEAPYLISNAEDFEAFLEAVIEEDI